ncbi:sigma 54-interacting transcriptional regulator (plasmid) [Sphingobium sp. SJ10-10]|uniref:sigma 54-interacting transcriptional regulator n=1 Tax=Sphingobium sp. SJ10-10 TaxID=3114999 RepID=UPI002E19D6C9|nr:sigma 54-interacting transcriptional regulator [Sphingobium sp. SJ10-10]
MLDRCKSEWHTTPKAQPLSLAPVGDGNFDMRVDRPEISVASELRFDFNRGSIEFADNRVAILHLSLYSKILSNIVRIFGERAAKEVFVGIGIDEGSKYKHGSDALFHNALNLSDILNLHKVAGLSCPELLSLSSKNGEDFFCELILRNSFEAEAFKRSCGFSTYPVCNIQVGHLSELVSNCFGRDITFVEVSCEAMGADECRVIGKESSSKHDLVGPPQEGRRVQPGEQAAVKGSGIVGSSTHLRLLIDHARKAAVTNASILITGETGVGKEVLARAVHSLSARSGKPFIAVNCGALPKDLIEAEMFGVAKGAYTGAVSARPGRFERANGGTLFLDEVGTLPMESQVKLLRTLDGGIIERLGDPSERHSDVRVIAATNVDLLGEARAGRFRLDLYQRLAVFPIHIPPLRERREDIEALIDYYLPQLAEKLGKPAVKISNEAAEYLKMCEWEGNVRELKNRIERAIILADRNSNIELCHVAYIEDQYRKTDKRVFDKPSVTNKNLTCDLDNIRVNQFIELLDHFGSMKEIENHVVSAALDYAKGNRGHAAKLLGITRTQINYRLRNTASWTPAKTG